MRCYQQILKTMSNIEKIRQKIERLYDGEVPKHDQQCDFGDGYFTGLATILNIIDTLLEEKPSEDLEKEIDDYLEPIKAWQIQEAPFTNLENCARHFYELGLNARKEEQK